MALMASTRREADEQSFPLFLYLLVAILALGIQSLAAKHFPPFAMLDLPLLVVIYFAITRQSPVASTIVGALMGIAQDSLTRQPLGVFGICNTVIGYLAGSLGVRIDTENHGMRLLLTFFFVMLHNAIDWVLLRHLLAEPMAWNWMREPIRAAVNAFVGVVIYALLDLAKSRE
jgi:rod shape-determining protein MreD